MSNNKIDGSMLWYKLKQWNTNSILFSDVFSGGKRTCPKILCQFARCNRFDVWFKSATKKQVQNKLSQLFFKILFYQNSFSKSLLFLKPSSGQWPCDRSVLRTLDDVFFNLPANQFPFCADSAKTKISLFQSKQWSLNNLQRAVGLTGTEK